MLDLIFNYLKHFYDPKLCYKTIQFLSFNYLFNTKKNKRQNFHWMSKFSIFMSFSRDFSFTSDKYLIKLSFVLTYLIN